RVLTTCRAGWRWRRRTSKASANSARPWTMTRAAGAEPHAIVAVRVSTRRAWRYPYSRCQTARKERIASDEYGEAALRGLPIAVDARYSLLLIPSSLLHSTSLYSLLPIRCSLLSSHFAAPSRGACGAPVALGCLRRTQIGRP